MSTLNTSNTPSGLTATTVSQALEELDVLMDIYAARSGRWRIQIINGGKDAILLTSETIESWDEWADSLSEEDINDIQPHIDRCLGIPDEVKIYIKMLAK